jgi:ABC-type uncharacterized transport system substrate-binding protein
MVASFHRGLNGAGFTEGQNVAIEYRWAEGQPDRLPALATDLVQRQVAVIVATGGNNPAIAAKAATSTIPIVFTSNDDPRKYDLVETLNRPGGNVTGVSWFSAELGSKRLALLHDMVPHATTVALLLNPNNAETARQPAELQDAAHALGLTMAANDAWASRTGPATALNPTMPSSGTIAQPCFRTRSSSCFSAPALVIVFAVIFWSGRASTSRARCSGPKASAILPSAEQ